MSLLGSLGHVLRVVIVMLVVPGTFVVLLPWRLAAATPEAHRVDLGALHLLGALPWLFGASLLLWSAAAFVLRGRGLPTAVDPPRQLVAHGLYRHVRNPMYVGAISLVAGHALWTGSLWLLPYGLALFATIHLFIVLYEEPRLVERFGRSYETYRERVPRWVPRLRADPER